MEKEKEEMANLKKNLAVKAKERKMSEMKREEPMTDETKMANGVDKHGSPQKEVSC